jgi:hypothetical protein
VNHLADDGPRDRPPGHRAENWSRRDNIRAGSVSGPWRSAPRGDAAGSAPPHGPRSAPPSGPPLAWTGRAPIPPAEEDTQHQEDALAVARRAPPARRGRASVIFGVLGGICIAAGIVGSAIYFGPGTGDIPINEAGPPPGGEGAPGPPDAAAAPTGVESDAAGPAALPAADLAPDQDMQAGPSAAAPALRLRIGPDLDPAREAAIVEALSADSQPGLVLERIPFRIAVSRVGYYHDTDRAAAAALAERMSPVVGDPAGPLVIRDYSELLPDAEPGRLDLWIADQAGDG